MQHGDVQVIEGARSPMTLEQLEQMMAWSFGAEGASVAKLWGAFNRELWGGALMPCPIWFPAATAYGKWAGLYTRNQDYQSLHIQIKHGVSFDDKAGILLHEMVHQYLGESRQDTKHNAKPWCSEIMRITEKVWGVQIWASPSSPRKVGGASVRVQALSPTGKESIPRACLAGWPHSMGLSVPLDKFI